MFVRKLPVQSRLGTVHLGSPGVSLQGVIAPSRFYAELTDWMTNSETELQVEISGANGFSYDEQGRLSLSYYDFYVDDLWDVDDFVELIDSVRGLADASGLGMFPSGIPFTFWEQYVHLRAMVAQNIGIALAMVFAVTLIVLFDFGACGQAPVAAWCA